MTKKRSDPTSLAYAIIWIVGYCLLMSVGDALSARVGIEKSVTLPIGLLLSVLLFVDLKRNGLLRTYGLCRAEGSARGMLFYLPLLLLLTANLWFGVTLSYRAFETVLIMITMLCVGFLEEVIFRGLLFCAMRRENEKAAVIVSSVTFGVGHIINLVNGSGAELIPNLLQVVYATAAGFMFVMILLKTKSLVACIVTHGVFNALSVFAVDAPTMTAHICSCIGLTVIAGAYALYVVLLMKKERPYV